MYGVVVYDCACIYLVVERNRAGTLGQLTSHDDGFMRVPDLPRLKWIKKSPWDWELLGEVK